MATQFDEVYQNLNDNQRLAVDTIEGPVMVIAGPGTGKTQVLTTRIANILAKTDATPDTILALTFTESAAKNMRERLTSIIGPTAYYVNITTFHAFCTEIIRNNPDEFLISLEAEPLSELEKIQVLQQIIDANSYEKLKPTNAPYFYTREIIQRISELKREGVLPEAYAGIITHEQANFERQKNDLKKSEILEQTKTIQKNTELLQIYRAYQEEISKRGRYDFEDMINFVITAFREKTDFLSSYQERFQYFLVDEYQDTNSAQSEVLYLLAQYWGNEANIFVVGDPNQSIYRFQGASLENIIDFQTRFNNVKVITLTDNYRSTQTILDASHDLILKNETTLPKGKFDLNQPLISHQTYPETKLRLVNLASETVEEYFILTEVQKLLNHDVNPESIAILYRNNADGGVIANLLSKAQILYNIEGGVNILQDPTINQLVQLLQLIEKSKTNLEDLDLFTVLHYEFLHFDSLEILKIARYASKNKTHLFNIIEDHAFLEDLKTEIPNIAKYQEFLNQVTLWQKLDANTTFSEFFETVMNESGYLDWVLSQPDSFEKLNRLNSLFSQIKSLNKTDHALNLTQFLTNLNLMTDNHLKIGEEDLDLTKGAVTLSTVHKAKGREWEYVFVIKAVSGKWGNKKRKELIKLPSLILKNSPTGDIDVNEEERRLFYVAMTRAKKELIITYSETTLSSSQKKENLPTIFIPEIEDNFFNKETLSPNAKEILITNLIPENQESQSLLTQKEQEFLRGLVEDFKLSPTALNTYLECPYKFKLNNLIKVPRAKEAYLSFGTAIHRALELFYQKYKLDGQLPNEKFLLDEFNQALKAEVFTAKDEVSQREKGFKILSAYYQHYKTDFAPTLFTEHFFGYGYSKPYLDDILLTGKVDRIDLIDSNQKCVKVVDYKTGKPKSRNFIEGNTADSDGGYKRQLVFYKLLSILDQSFDFTVTETELDFIETDVTGKYHRESFEIADEEISNLKQTIRETVAKIRNLEFERINQVHICEKCEYKNHCFPNGLPQEE